MAEMILEVSGLTVRRRGTTAVENVSFSLAAESDTALVGPNGAGKSTLVQAILGLLPHQGGQVRLLGERLDGRGRLSASVREQIAYLPQRLALTGPIPLTVTEFVGLGWDGTRLRLPWRGEVRRRDAIHSALAKTGCEVFAEQRISDLSGGQLKRVLLAFCVVRPRRLLVLDEAQAGLDPQASEAFQQLLFSLRRSEGWTILQVSHDLDMVRRTCDGVLCLNRSLRCSGSPDHALSQAQLERLYGRDYLPYHHHHGAGG
ncbi:metal ABC transporter ATP-binding protein [Synechococcus sp. CS-1328]|uniref:metal ABC transporter ATP-binding protein n=1 Tax=Synechococcus sp. CS-1328 TaxID=2847976 RepID=UPI00223C2021|nr:metal ABC transporter ATP-binding protein [Synechococcus sp. CS-1328]MCT0226569.1 metal ABC transporter ATP-binding protein [Synechococcus sp. CS-1328]